MRATDVKKANHRSTQKNTDGNAASLIFVHLNLPLIVSSLGRVFRDVVLIRIAKQVDQNRNLIASLIFKLDM